MDINIKRLNDSELCSLFLQIKQELKTRNISLKENKIRERLTSKSHNVQSSLPKLSNQKARAVDKQARVVTSKSK